MSLTSELDDPRSPISRYLRERFPNVRHLQRRYREPVADAAPLAPNDAAAVVYATLGGAFDWRLRFLLTPAPDLHLAFLGASMLGERFQGLAVELFGVLGGTVPPRAALTRPRLPAARARPGAGWAGRGAPGQSVLCAGALHRGVPRRPAARLAPA